MSDPISPKPTNRPGLPALSYRIGDYASFRRSLLAHLASALRLGGRPAPLSKLTTRLNDDPAIALLDAWAVVADVLTFYQERILNEGYLRTATERRSILELARTIGYELNPGVAASTLLAFTVETTPGSPGVAIVPQGTQIQSVPGAGELPQTFETSQAITARADWNALKPRASRPQVIRPTTQQLYLEGIATQLQAGDPLLLLDQGSSSHLLDLTTVASVPPAGYTLVQWQRSLPSLQSPLRDPRVFAFRQRAGLFGNNAPQWQDMPDEVKRSAAAAQGTPIASGIFRSTDQGKSWISVSTGLPSQDILCLAAHPRSGDLFAGTPGQGILRSVDQGNTWIGAKEGLTNLNIHTLLIDQRGHLLVGTSGGGVFRSKDDGKNWMAIHTGSVRVESKPPDAPAPPTEWQSVNTGLPNTVVRSLLTYQSASTYYLFAGTDDSIYRSTNQGQDWYSEKILPNIRDNPNLDGLPDKAVYALVATPTLAATGTLARVVEAVQGTALTQELRPGDTITVPARSASAASGPEQSRQVTQVWDTVLTLDQPFESMLADTSFQITHHWQGKITYRNRVLRGLETAFTQELPEQGGTLIIDPQGPRLETAIAARTSTELQLTTPFNVDLGSGKPFQIVLGKNLTGEVSQTDGRVMTINADSLPQALQQNDLIRLAGQESRITAVTFNTVLTIDSAFDGSGSSVSFNAIGHSPEILEISGNQVRIHTTELTHVLKVNDQITIAGQTKTITAITSTVVLTLEAAVNQPLGAGVSFDLLRDGQGTIANDQLLLEIEDSAFLKFLKINDQLAIESLAQTRRIVGFAAHETPANTLILTLDGVFDANFADQELIHFTTTHPGSGTLKTSETQIEVKNLQGTLQPGDTLTLQVDKEFTTRKITASATADAISVITLAPPFPHQDLAVPAKLQNGVAFSAGSEADLFAGTDQGIYRSRNYGKTWIDVNFNDLSVKPAVNALITYKRDSSRIRTLYAATDRGIYRSTDQGQLDQQLGESWEDIRGGDLTGPRPNVRSLAYYQLGDTYYIFAATSIGFFYATDDGSLPDAGKNWKRIQLDSTDLISTKVLTCATTSSGSVFAGTQFVGLTPAEVKARTEGIQPAVLAAKRKEEWPDFQIRDGQAIDLDSLYPKVLAGSWMVLVDDSDRLNAIDARVDAIADATRDQPPSPPPRLAVRQIKRVTTRTRSDFGLTAKVT
ncbi:MAG TPA: hypothetical protein V6C57_13100, partial [Coleofasciculaceae cyanobacterium]